MHPFDILVKSTEILNPNNPRLFISYNPLKPQHTHPHTLNQPPPPQKKKKRNTPPNSPPQLLGLTDLFWRRQPCRGRARLLLGHLLPRGFFGGGCLTSTKAFLDFSQSISEFTGFFSLPGSSLRMYDFPSCRINLMWRHVPNETLHSQNKPPRAQSSPILPGTPKPARRAAPPAAVRAGLAAPSSKRTESGLGFCRDSARGCFKGVVV